MNFFYVYETKFVVCLSLLKIYKFHYYVTFFWTMSQGKSVNSDNRRNIWIDFLME